MKKRVIALLLLTLVLAISPAAMANHCLRCRPLLETCGSASNYGHQICEWDTFENRCYTQFPCGAHAAAAPEALAAEFTVASVERLDEPQQNAASETLVASNDTARNTDTR